MSINYTLTDWIDEKRNQLTIVDTPDCEVTVVMDDLKRNYGINKICIWQRRVAKSAKAFKDQVNRGKMANG